MAPPSCINRQGAALHAPDIRSQFADAHSDSSKRTRRKTNSSSCRTRSRFRRRCARGLSRWSSTTPPPPPHNGAKLSGRARPSPDTGAVVPDDAAQPADLEPIDAVPLNAIAPRLRRQAPPAPVNREEPPCLRTHILPALGLRADLPVHFIHEKRVTDTDLDVHQNRFRIPTDGALRLLRPILTVEELDSANLLYDPATMPREQLELEPEDGSAAAGKEREMEQGKKKRKRKGQVHGGLPVKLVDLAAGASRELLLSRWSSSHGTIVKGGGYMDYIRRCSFKEKDVVEIWAFKQRAFRLFGTTVYDESPLHVLIVKRDGTQQQCRYCPGP